MINLLGALVGPVTDIISKAVPDKDQAAKLAHEISTMAETHAQEIALAQISVNKEEAKGNWFQSSWRPATGWCCVLGLATNFLIAPIAGGFGVNMPQADMSVMMPLLLGMLGLAGMRSFDKTKNTAK